MYDYQVIEKNGVYYTDWMAGRDQAIETIEEYIAAGDGTYEDFVFRNMTFEDVENHYPGEYTRFNWME